MKRLIIFATVAILAMSACAQSSEVKKYINKYDISYCLKGMKKGDADKFWDAVQSHNKRVEEIGKAIEEGKKTALQTADYLMNACALMLKYDDTVEGYQELTDRVAKDVGINDKKNQIRIINDDTYNASMDPMGWLRINTGTIRMLTYEELRAICAHEVAHLACMHTFDRAWKSEKKKKKNRFLAELGTGLLAGAAAATAGYGIANGVEMRSANTILANADYFLDVSYADADGATLRYKYRYSRDEEIEADIIAYRFMEYMGYGTEHWISAMRKMARLQGSESTRKAGKYDDHPSTAFRLQVLAAMESGYEAKKK